MNPETNTTGPILLTDVENAHLAAQAAAAAAQAVGMDANSQREPRRTVRHQKNLLDGADALARTTRGHFEEVCSRGTVRGQGGRARRSIAESLAMIEAAAANIRARAEAAALHEAGLR